MAKKTTTRQKKLAEVIVENAKLDKPLNNKEMLSKVGYSEGMARSRSKEVIESEGVKQELEILGFTLEAAQSVVSEIMNNGDAKDGDRLKATDQVFKVRGGYAPEKKVALNVNISSESVEAQELADKYEEELRNTL